MRRSTHSRSMHALGVLAAALLAGCTFYRVPVRPPAGALYTHYRAPLTTQFSGTPATHSRHGRAGTFYIMIPTFIGPPLTFAWEDASVEKAAQDGNITRLHYADHEFTSVFGIFGHYETIAYGE